MYTIVTHNLLGWELCLESKIEYLHILWKQCFSGFSVIQTNKAPRQIQNKISVESKHNKYLINNIGYESDDIYLILGMTYELALSNRYLSSSEYLFLHGGALLKDDKLSLIIAPTCNGKSTLSALLCMNDFVYLSDDVIPISITNLCALTFPKIMFIRNYDILLNYKNPIDYFNTFEFTVKSINLSSSIDNRIPLYPLHTQKTDCSCFHKIDRVYFIQQNDKLNKSICADVDLSYAYTELLKNIRNPYSLNISKMPLINLIMRGDISFQKIEYKLGYDYLDFFI